MYQTTIVENNYADIARTCFGSCSTNPYRLIMTVICNFLVSILYIASNAYAFTVCDKVLKDGFVRYGQDWKTWTEMPNTIDYIHLRKFMFKIQISRSRNSS